MDSRYFHHNRYVSHPQPQQPPPPQPAPPKTPNFYSHHHSNLLSSPFHPPPPPPPPPQISYTQFQNPQLLYNPNEVNHNHNRDAFQNPRSSFDYPQSSRVVYPSQFDEYSSRLHVNQPSVRETQLDFRALSDNWRTVSYSSKLDNDSYGRRFDSQYRPKSKRVIDDLQFVPVRGGDDSYYRRIHGSDMMSRDFRGVSSQSSHEHCGNYKDRREILYEHGKGNPIEMERERERLSSRGSREESYEFNRNSRKAVQKKSAFLRIQKPYYRNRDDGRGHHPTYFNDSKYAAFKGKDQNLRSGDGVGEPVREKSRDGEVLREKSPIKLDVSFKSNSLVCKAIANPLLNSSLPPDIDETLRITSKGKKVSVHDRDYTSIAKENRETIKLKSSVTVPNTESMSGHDEEKRETAKLESSVSVPNTDSSACQDVKQSVREIPSHGLVNASSNSLVAAPTGTGILAVKSKMESSSKLSEKSASRFVSGKTPSLKVAKNRKVVKRVVRKVVNGKISSKSLQQPTKSVACKPSGNFVHVRCPPASSKPNVAASLDSVDNSGSQPRPTDAKKVANSMMSSKSLQLPKKAVACKPAGDLIYVRCPSASSKPDNAASVDSVDNSDSQPCSTDAKEATNGKMCSSLQVVKKSVLPTPAGDFVDVNCSPSSNKLDKPASMDSVENSDSQPCQTDALKDKDDKLQGVANCMTLDHGSTSPDSSWEALDGSTNECSNTQVHSVGREGIKSDEILSKCQSVNELQVMQHLVGDMSKQRSETMCCNVSKVEGVIKHPPESGNCFLSDTKSVKATTEVLWSEEEKPRSPNEDVSKVEDVIKQAFESGNPSLSGDKYVCRTSEVLVPQEDMSKQLNASMSSNINKVKDVIKQSLENKNCFLSDDKSVGGTSEVLVSQEDLSKQLNASMLESKVEDVAKQPVESGNLFVSCNDSSNANPELLLSQEDNCDFDLNSEKSDVSEGLPIVCCTNMEVDICLTNSKEKITDSELDDRVGCELPSTGQNGSSANTDSDENQVQNTGVSSKLLSLSYAGESKDHKIDPSVGFSNWKEGSILDSNGYNILSVYEISNQQTGIDVGSLSSPDGADISLENLTIEKCLNGPRDANEEDASYPSPNIRTAEIPELDLPASEVSKMTSETVNIPTPASWIDTTLRLSIKLPSVGKTGIIGDECDIGSLNHCVDNVNVFSTSDSTVLEAKVSVSNSVNAATNLVSSGKSKKRKNLCTSGPELYNSIASGINDGPVLSMSTPCSSEKSSAKHEDDVGSLELQHLCASDIPPLKKGISRLHKRHSELDYLGTVDSDRRMPKDDDVDNREGVRSYTISEEMVFLGANTTCSLEPRDDHIIDATCHENNDSMDTDNDEGVKIDLDNAKDQVSVDGMTALSHIPLQNSAGSEERMTDTDTGNEKRLSTNDDLLILSNKGSVSGDSYKVSITSSSDGLGTDISFLSSPEILSASRGTSPCQGTVLKAFGLDGCSNEKPEIEGGSNLINAKSFAKSTRIQDDHVVNEMTESISIGSKSDTCLPNVSSRKFDRSKNQRDHTVSKTYHGRSSSHATHSRTWHRIDSSVSASPSKKALSLSGMQWQLPNKGSKLQSSSYIRKGNSLVRNSYPGISQTHGGHAISVSTSKRNSSDKGQITRAGTEYGIDDISRGKNASPEGPTSSPLTNNQSLLRNYISSSLGELICGPGESNAEHTKVTESSNLVLSSGGTDNVSKIEVTQNGQSNNLESYGEQNNGNVVSENVKAVRYLKRKSNQLVAYPVDTDGYYKRRKNQLIRTSQGELKQADDISEESISKGQTTNFVPSRSSSMRQLRKAVTKTSSLVWTLNGAQLSKSNVSTLHCQKVLPHLFPWKRATYWRTISPASASSVNYSSSTVIGKLLLLRKRDTVYTRSRYGFSLRKSKVLSVGGSSLKWSKSIESRSKKANEEATLAVALVERKKREQNASASISSSGAKYKKGSTRKSGERIFRIGSVRYRMDSSRCTLHRISDDESGTSAPQSEKDAKKCFIPRRLIIGKDEYIRIGNGNQLVRDPKKRFRILASEKVRWSLHTVRSRWARKRKYCQFFTRYGKCNKADGKCPYIHDSSKIAVCTKFLKGLCSNANCKLTHEVIPERMPDCSYFLQGLCTNRHCPYRHVHVNPNASTCEGFLRGYCADGNECRKKHSYVCPIFEATGSCSQGLNCKLHHPKTKTKGKKSKRSRAKKSSRGRYFGIMQHRLSGLANAVSEKHHALASNAVEGSPADFISLDVSDGEAEDEYNATEQRTTSSKTSDVFGLKLKSVDELIRPVRILNSETSEASVQ